MRYGLAILSVFLAFAGPSLACNPPNHLDADDRAAADSVFIGRITAMRMAFPPKGELDDMIVVLTFDEVRTTRGQTLPKTLEVYGQSGSFDPLPASLPQFISKFGSTVEVGIVSPAKIKAHTKCETRLVRGQQGHPEETVICRTDLPIVPSYLRPEPVVADRPWIVGHICTVPYIRSIGPRRPRTAE